MINDHLFHHILDNIFQLTLSESKYRIVHENLMISARGINRL